MASNVEIYRAPVGPRGLRDICDQDDDGQRNWFVTLAYWDLSRLTAAYTHAYDDGGTLEPVTAEAAPAIDLTARSAAVQKQARELFADLYKAADAAVEQAGRSRRVVGALRSEAGLDVTTRTDVAGERPLSPGAVVALLADVQRPPGQAQLPGDRWCPPLNANFCTFATWSSLTLGRDIRNIRLPRRFDRLTGEHVRRAITNLVVDARRTHGMELAKLLGLGQRVVLWEVGSGLHAVFVGQQELDDLEPVRKLDFRAFNEERRFTDDATTAAEEVISTWLALIIQPRGAAGLGQLRSKDLALGLASYHLARCAARQAHEARGTEKERRLWKWVSELVLRGNILIGGYEQRRVGQLLQYPVEDFASEFLLERGGFEARERSGEGRWQRRVDWRVRRELRHRVPEIWARLFTDQVLVFWAGDELLRLGRDLPPPPGATAFLPDDLQDLEDDWLEMVWRLYDHSYGDGQGTQSRIWSVFADRMNFIVNFMRSRAQTPGLWQDPFEPWEAVALRGGQTPRSQDDPAS
jgi:hypothetical protein